MANQQIDPVALNALIDQFKVNVNALLSPLPTVIPSLAPVVIPPTITAYKNTSRYSLAKNAYKLDQYGFVPETPINGFTDLKGSANMAYAGVAVPLLSGALPLYKQVGQHGVMFMQNELNIKYIAQLGNSAPYPQEQWFVLLKPNYFVFESFINTTGAVYFGEMGSATNGLRFQSSANNVPGGWIFTGVTIPVNQFFTVMLRLTAANTSSAQVELWVNGVKIANSTNVSTYYRTVNLLCIGADSNNEYVGWAELINMNGITTETQRSQIQAELNAEYNIGQTIQLPYADNVQLTINGNTTTAAYTFVNPLGFPEDTTKRQIRWVIYGPGASIQTATYNHAYDNMLTIPIALHGGRVEITVYDTQGNHFSLPESININ